MESRRSAADDRVDVPAVSSSPLGSGRDTRKLILLDGSHLVALAAGFALGVHLLPILTAPPAPPAPTREAAVATAGEAAYTVRYVRMAAVASLRSRVTRAKHSRSPSILR